MAMMTNGDGDSPTIGGNGEDGEDDADEVKVIRMMMVMMAMVVMMVMMVMMVMLGDVQNMSTQADSSPAALKYETVCASPSIS
eukprot:12423844-Karenia_brevis.AAC.2